MLCHCWCYRMGKKIKVSILSHLGPVLVGFALRYVQTVGAMWPSRVTYINMDKELFVPEWQPAVAWISSSCAVSSPRVCPLLSLQVLAASRSRPRLRVTTRASTCPFMPPSDPPTGNCWPATQVRSFFLEQWHLAWAHREGVRNLKLIFCQV